MSIKPPSISDYSSGILKGDRGMLSRAITLVESTSPKHRDTAQELLEALMPYTGNARRIGITGVPGVGKSTFIEMLGCHVIQEGSKLAVLTIDPSSKRSGGSILGDKTRMERLSLEPNAYIRPSPAGDSLGGVATKTRETMLLCEAAGFNVVIVETVGVGQAETTLRSMVDFFLLLLLPGAGDELQAIKKGIVEIADAILINKADGDNLQRAALACADHRAVMGCVHQSTESWKTPVETCSGLTGKGIPEIWKCVASFYEQLEPKGIIAKRRRSQMIEWMNALVETGLKTRFANDSRIKNILPEIRLKVLEGQIPASSAADELLRVFFEGIKAGKPGESIAL